MRTSTNFRLLSVSTLFLIVTSMVAGCGNSEPPPAFDLKEFKENLDSRTTEESIFVSDETGNRRDNQSVKMGESIWVAGSFRYSGKKSDISVFIVAFSKIIKGGISAIAGSVAGNLKVDDDSDRVTFLEKIIAPTEPGEYTLSANMHGTIFVKTKITVVE